MKNKNYSVWLSVLFVVVINVSFSGLHAQISYFYDNGSVTTSNYLKGQKGSSMVSQITLFDHDFVSGRIHRSLVQEVDMIPMEETVKKSSGEYTVYSRRYKSKYSTDLNSKLTITTEYTTLLLSEQTVIISAKIYGDEDYIGEFIQEFWNPTMNTLDKDKGEVMKFDFMDDNISVQLYEDKDSWLDMASLVITNNRTKDLAQFKNAFNKFMSDFKKDRELTHSLSKVASQSYAKNSEKLTQIVTQHFLGLNTSFDGQFKVISEVDTSGQVKWSFSSVVPESASLLEKLSKLTIEKYQRRDLFMSTRDEYEFAVNNFNESGLVFLKKSSFASTDDYVFETGSERFQDAIDSGDKSFLSQGRGKYTVRVTRLLVDGQTNSKNEVENFDKKSGVKGILTTAGAAAILGVGVYYFFIK